MLKTKRGLLKWIFLSLITLGIYEWYIIHKMAEEANLADKKGKKSGDYLHIFSLDLLP